MNIMSVITTERTDGHEQDRQILPVDIALS